MRRRLTATFVALTLVLTCFAIPASAASSDNLIYRVGAKERTVTAGQEFELKVRHGKALDDDQIKWSISNNSIVKFEDNDKYDDEVDLKALKKGTVKVTAKNLETGGKLVYTVTVKASDLGPYKIRAVGKFKKYVEADDDIELKVVKGSKLKNNQIKWTIEDKSLLRFEDGDNIGKEVEVEAKGKTGTTKVTVHNLKTGGKLVYTVTVTPDIED